MKSNKNELLPSVYRLDDLAAREAIASALPRNIFIEVTNRCNLVCTTCPRTYNSYENLNSIRWETFLRIADQFPEMERAVLHGIGEPLLNKELARMIAFLKAHNVTVLFNTNATLLTEVRARELIAAGLDELRVSLDSLNPRTYHQIRGAPLLDKLIANLKGFVKLKDELGVDHPHLSLWMMGMKETIHELPDLVRLAADLGIPNVYLQRLVYYAHEPDSPGMMNANHGLVTTHKAEIQRFIKEAEALTQSLDVSLYASGATTAIQSIEKSTERMPWAQCARPWTTAYITANGNALPCCISPFATMDYQSLILGNVFDQPFEDLWNAEPYQIWRTQLLSEQPHEACAGCGTYWSL
jgi:MoaA/NifB/PqqE/SkfB family radical SAM enzyme